MKTAVNKKPTLVTKTHFDKAVKQLDQKIDDRFKESYKVMDKKFAESYKVMDKKFAESYKVMDKKFDAIQNYLEYRLDSIEKEQKENRDFRDRALATLDWLVGAFKKFDEEHALLSGKYSDIQDRIDDHEERLVHIERTKTFQ